MGIPGAFGSDKSAMADKVSENTADDSETHKGWILPLLLTRFGSGLFERRESLEGRRRLSESAKDTVGKGLCTKLYPSAVRQEFREQYSLAWPSVLAILFQFTIGPVSIMFCGHLGRTELDATSLAISLINISGICVGYGMTMTCDTFFSQAFGSGNKYMVGVFLQRSLIILTFTCILCWTIHLNAEAILILAGQDQKIAKLAGQYLLYLFPGLLFHFYTCVAFKYMQNQNFAKPPLVISALGNGFNALGHYVGVFVLDGKTMGSAVSQVLSYAIMATVSFLYIFITGLYKETWNGWSWKALQGWWQFTALATGGMIMYTAEWWSFEVGIWLCGLLGPVELGSTSIIFQLESLLVVLPAGLACACSIRVGQHLGAGSVNEAKTAHRVAQTFAWAVFLIKLVVILSLRPYVALLFSNDRDVIELTSHNLPILIAVTFLDSITCVSGGVLRGCGRQWVGAVCTIVGNILLGLPTASLLMFVARIGGIGFWIGLVSGIAPIAAIYIIIIYRTNWAKETKLALERTGEKPTKGEAVTADDKTALLVNEPQDKLTRAEIRRLIGKACVVTGVVLGIFAIAVAIRLSVPLP